MDEGHRWGSAIVAAMIQAHKTSTSTVIGISTSKWE